MVSYECQVKDCSKYKSTRSIQIGSFFANSNLSLQTWVHAIYLWTENIGEKLASRQLNISEKTMVDCYNFFREVCMNYFRSNPISLGGSGVVVEVDESCFSHKSKYHRGRIPASTLWVLSLVDTSVRPAIGYMEIVDKRDADTLLPIIQRVVRTGSIIHTDEWRSYRNLQGLGFTHRTVNHSVNFVNPINGVHTQNIESYWNKHKSQIKKMHGCRREFLPSYIQEFMWRDRFGVNGFANLCRHIALQYPQ